MALIAILYPLLSVVPQEFAFRVFFFRRYEPILGQGHAMRLTNALLFGWAHIVMHNSLAVVLSVLGGYLFALTYQRTRSLPAVCLEHALYGVFLFFIGWGTFFFAGARGAS